MQRNAEWYVDIDHDIITSRQKKATVRYDCRLDNPGPPEDRR